MAREYGGFTPDDDSTDYESVKYADRLKADTTATPTPDVSNASTEAVQTPEATQQAPASRHGEEWLGEEEEYGNHLDYEAQQQTTRLSDVHPAQESNSADPRPELESERALKSRVFDRALIAHREMAEQAKINMAKNGHGVDEATWDNIINKAAEKRVADFNVEREVKLEQLRRKAEEGIATIDRIMQDHEPYASNDILLDTTRDFDYLGSARESLRGRIRMIDRDGYDWVFSRDESYFESIPHEVRFIEATIDTILQAEASHKSHN
jgi:hypothetical protein